MAPRAPRVAGAGGETGIGGTPVDELALLADLHRDGARQGPGGEEETRLAVTLSGLRGRGDLRIADIGCGTGASTLVLARELDARITAIDLLPAFLAVLESAAARAGLGERIHTRAGSMDSLPFGEAELDAIWAEGAIYTIGFAAGVEAWRRHLRPGGVLAVSELTWLTDTRPEPLQTHWNGAYPEVDTASAKMAVLERLGFTPLGYFPLPEGCWLDNYYRPMQRRFPAFLDRHGHSDAARALVAAEEAEIALYERHSAFVGYGFYIARRTDA
jgi:SAM-dependent methyltransferase